MSDQLFHIKPHGYHGPIPFQVVGEIITRKSEAEKIAARRAYRRKYARKESTRDKMLERAKDPERIKRRKEYASRPEVKKRKQELASLNRAVRRKLKEEQPHVYEKLVDDIISSNISYPTHLGEEQESNDEFESNGSTE